MSTRTPQPPIPRFTLARKTALLFLLLGAIWAIGGITLHNVLNEVSGTATDINHYGSLRYISQSIQRTLEETSENTDRQEKTRQRIDEFETHLAALEKSRSSNPLIIELGTVRGAWLVYRNAVLRFLAQDHAPPDRGAALRALAAQVDTLVNLSNRATWNLAQNTENLHDTIHTLQFTVTLLSGIFLLFAYFLARRRVILPLSDLVETIRRFTNGEHDVRSSYEARDEIGCLANAFNDMASTTTRHIDTIKASLEDVRKQGAELEKLSQAIRHSPASVVITDAFGIIEYVNPCFVEVTGYTPDDVIGQRPSLLKSGRTPADTYRQLWHTILAGEVWRGELVNRRKNGEFFWENTQISPIRSGTGEITHFVAVKEDITARKHAEQALADLNDELEQRVLERTRQLHEAAHHDALTGLPNRKLIRQFIYRALVGNERDGRPFALMLIDLDRFKVVNDGLGHEAGDNLLQKMADRIRASLREDDVVARLGGDEFLVLLADAGDESIAAVAARKVIAAVEPAMNIAGNSIHATVSIGIVLAPRDGSSTETLLKNADLAMYAAKNSGRNDFRFFAAEMNTASEQRFAMETALRGALERGEFEVYYQPQIDLTQKERICGFEALLRWHQPGVGTIAPADFIPIAEETGLIVPIGKWVLMEACRQACIWRERFNSDLRIAVNLSARQFFEPSLIQDVAQVLAESGLPAPNLELELTESIIMDNPEQSARMLQQLKTKGVGLAVDDFGTGYSSLAYLRHFPVDTLKIDRSFVKDLTTSSDDAAICVSIIAMAHALRIKVVAEGIETESQLGFFARRGCDVAQGYLFGKPLPADDCTELLRRGGSWPVALSGPEHALLLVSDDDSAGAALKELFRNDDCQAFLATNFIKAFDLLALHQIGVLVLEARTLGTTAGNFLCRMAELYPETVCMAISDPEHLKDILEAINRGAVHRFFTTRCDRNVLRAAVREAFEHRGLQQQNILLTTRFEEAAAHVARLEAQAGRRQSRDAQAAGGSTSCVSP
jgi:diguanylate cyclase (GGDEF)-like protein/PAS domain S-box-containing protein